MNSALKNDNIRLTYNAQTEKVTVHVKKWLSVGHKRTNVYYLRIWRRGNKNCQND